MLARRLTVVLGILVLFGACGEAAGEKVKIGEDIELSLAQACVVAGAEQVLTVRAPQPAVALVETRYADGKGGGPTSGGYGGGGSEFLPESGVIEMKWRVSKNAPPGPVMVDVGILQDEQKTETLEFKLVASGKSC